MEYTSSLAISKKILWIFPLTIAVWFFGASCFQIFLGPLADHFGYRKVLLNGVIFFIVACLICATTQHISRRIYYRNLLN